MTTNRAPVEQLKIEQLDRLNSEEVIVALSDGSTVVIDSEDLKKLAAASPNRVADSDG